MPLTTAGVFLFGSVLLGTSAESINDMAVNHRVRSSLTSGQSQLALCQNGAYVAAQFLVLLCELAPLSGAHGGPSSSSQREETRHMLFATWWAAFQVVRAVALRDLEPNASLTLATLIFVDKLTGPMGLFAIDTAGVVLLRRHALGAASATTTTTTTTAAEPPSQPAMVNPQQTCADDSPHHQQHAGMARSIDDPRLLAPVERAL